MRLQEKRKQTLKPAPVNISRSVEVEYRNELMKLVKELKEDVRNNIYPILNQYKAEYTPDAAMEIKDDYAAVLAEAFETLVQRYGFISKLAGLVSSKFVGKAAKANRERFVKSLEKAAGIDVNQIIQNEGLGDILTAKTRENVSLIKSIPDEYFKKLETLVFNKTTRKTSYGSLISEIEKLGSVTEKRARLIARDQTAKLNAAITQQRQQNLGIEEYVWRTSQDDRVRDSHKSKNGKTFRWDSPPKDTGHPGEDIQCRCIAQPIIKI